MQYWLVKSEPDAYSWDDLEKEQEGIWDGVRNYQARNNLAQMQLNDLVLFYHSVTEKCVVGIATVSQTAFPDPTTEDNRWWAIKLKPVQKLAHKVTLQHIKQHDELQGIALLRQSRLSVMPLSQQEFEVIVRLGNE
jgi:predicted RNA-binding protein with PUA-like domain